MKEKLIYDKNRHFEIKANGKKAKILNYLFKTNDTGKSCVVLKTKIRNTLASAWGWNVPYTLEIPSEEGIIKITGKVCAYMDTPNMCEIWLEIIP